jgi:hypothetical protein
MRAVGDSTRPPPKREKDRLGKPVWYSAPGVRTIRMCSLDARGEGPIQATLLRNEGAWRERDGKREQPGGLLARRTCTMKQCSFDARSKSQPGYALRGQKVSRDIRRADSGIDCGFAAYPVDGTGRKIEEVLEVQVDLPPTRMFRRPCYYDAWQPAAD